MLGAAGAYSYFNLGRAEDPSFTIKTMVVNVAWPGATATEMQTQVADKIEKKLQELPYLDRVESYSQPGVSFIQVYAASTRRRPPRSRSLWYQVRKKVGDIRGDLPAGIDRPELQRRIRRRLFGDLHAHRRRPEPRRAQGPRRGHPPAAPARARCQQGRHHRRAAARRSSSSSATPSSRRSASRRSRSSTASPGRTPSSPAARSTPRPTAINLRVTGAFSGVDAIAAVPVAGERAGVPARRHRDRQARLPGPAELHRARGRQAGARARRLHAGRRQHHHPRREPRRSDGRDRSPSCRSASR